MRFGGLGPKHERHPKTILLNIYISCPATEPDEHNPIAILSGRPTKKKTRKKNKKLGSHCRIHWDDKKIQPTIPHNWDDIFFIIPVFSGTGMNNPNLYLKACTCSTKTETPWHVLTGRRKHEEKEDPFGNVDHVFVVEHVFLCAFGPFWGRVGTPRCSRGRESRAWRR